MDIRSQGLGIFAGGNSAYIDTCDYAVRIAGEAVVHRIAVGVGPHDRSRRVHLCRERATGRRWVEGCNGAVAGSDIAVRDIVRIEVLAGDHAAIIEASCEGTIGTGHVECRVGTAACPQKAVSLEVLVDDVARDGARRVDSLGIRSLAVLGSRTGHVEDGHCPIRGSQEAVGGVIGIRDNSSKVTRGVDGLNRGAQTFGSASPRGVNGNKRRGWWVVAATCSTTGPST